MAKQRATIQDVARMCGFSTATVSRVINRNGRFSPETERQVRDVIRQLGYVPNQTAQNLRTRSSKLAGILVSQLSYEYVNQIVTQLEDELFRQGYIGIVCNIGDNFENEQTYLDAVFSLNICALFVFASGQPIQLPEGREIPVIYINRAPENLDAGLCCAIETDSVAAGYKACRELLRAGCRRVAIVRRQFGDSRLPRSREVGFMKALQEQGVTCDERLSVSVAENAQYGDVYAAVGEKLDAGLAADGYFCESDIFALSTIRCLERRGLRVPEDVKVVGCNDLSVAQYNYRTITTVRHQTEAICRQAVENMRRLLEDGALEQRHTVFDVELVPRETT